MVVRDIVDLTAASTEFGANVTAADFTIADGASITFYIPWIDNSSSPTRFTDVDNITINSVSAIPEPTSLALLGVAGICCFVGRRRRNG